MSENKETRDRVRALVKQVLETVPFEEDEEKNLPEHVVVNSLKDEIGKEFDRDESAKSILTEDDLRGLETGAKLRVAENAKFTSLAEDIIKDRNIELIYKQSKRGSLKVKSVAVGCDHGGFETKEKLKKF